MTRGHVQGPVRKVLKVTRGGAPIRDQWLLHLECEHVERRPIPLDRVYPPEYARCSQCWRARI